MKTCKDEVIAVIDVRNGMISMRRPKHYTTTFIGLDAFLHYQQHYNQPIVIVTESPHIEEFRVHNLNDALTGEPVVARPVNGASGQNIMQHLAAMIGQAGVILPDGRYPVILMNALQEQCSEGKDTLVCRTKNFLQLWQARQVYLEQRLNSVNPLMVLCSCTVGDFRLDNGMAAYHSGQRSDFERYFKQLLETDFHLAQVEQPAHYNFMGSLDLSGLVLDVIDRIFGSSGQPVYKTSHPAAWRHRTPTLRQYRKTHYFYTLAR